MDNYAIRKLQEQIIGQVTNINSLHLIMPKIHASLQIAAQVVLDESIKCVEHELASMDVEEHMERPPRTVIKSSE